MDACNKLHLLHQCKAEVAGGTATNRRVAEDAAEETVTARTLGGEAEDSINPTKTHTSSKTGIKGHSKAGTKGHSRAGTKVRRPTRGDLVTPGLYLKPQG